MGPTVCDVGFCLSLRERIGSGFGTRKRQESTSMFACLDSARRTRLPNSLLPARFGPWKSGRNHTGQAAALLLLPGYCHDPHCCWPACQPYVSPYERKRPLNICPEPVVPRTMKLSFVEKVELEFGFW